MVNGHKIQYNKHVMEQEKKRKEMMEERQQLKTSLTNLNQKISSLISEIKYISQQLMESKESKQEKQKKVEELKQKNFLLQTYKVKKQEEIEKMKEQMEKAKHFLSQLDTKTKTKENSKYYSFYSKNNENNEISDEISQNFQENDKNLQNTSHLNEKNQTLDDNNTNLETKAQKIVREQSEIIFQKLFERYKKKEEKLFGEENSPKNNFTVEEKNLFEENNENFFENFTVQILNLAPKQLVNSLVLQANKNTEILFNLTENKKNKKSNFFNEKKNKNSVNDNTNDSSFFHGDSFVFKSVDEMLEEHRRIHVDLFFSSENAFNKSSQIKKQTSQLLSSSPQIHRSDIA